MAGSDTTVSVLSNIFYYLLSHPEYYRRLREEIDAIAPVTDINASVIDVKALSGLPLLNAVMSVAPLLK